MKHLRWLLFLLATPACAQFIPHAPAKGGYCLNPSNVWIPLNASMQTGSALPNGAPAGDLYGLNSNGTWYGLACDASGKLIIPGAGSPAGSNQQIQFNDNGDFAGASGGTTDGTHFAFGAGSTVDSGPTVFADGVPLSPNVVQTVSEASTDPNLENGLYLNLALNPSDATSNTAYALWVNANADGANWNGSTGIRGIAGTVNYIGTGTGDSAMQQLGPAIESAVIDSSSGEIQNAYGGQAGIFGIGTGEIDYAEAGRSVNTNLAGIMDSSVEHVFLFQSENGVTDTNINAQIMSPNLSNGATITTNIGLDIQDQSGAGISTAYNIHSEGSGLNLFDGKVENGGLVETAAAPTVTSGQVGFGGTTAAASNCNQSGVLTSVVACTVINVAGTPQYQPYF